MKENKRRDYTPWRVGTLVLVYVLMVAHVVHWKLAGRTLAPLELNEVMYTLELGIVTAGFLFMALLVVLTMIFVSFLRLDLKVSSVASANLTDQKFVVSHNKTLQTK